MYSNVKDQRYTLYCDYCWITNATGKCVKIKLESCPLHLYTFSAPLERQVVPGFSHVYKWPGPYHARTEGYTPDKIWSSCTEWQRDHFLIVLWQYWETNWVHLFRNKRWQLATSVSTCLVKSSPGHSSKLFNSSKVSSTRTWGTRGKPDPGKGAVDM